MHVHDHGCLPDGAARSRMRLVVVMLVVLAEQPLDRVLDAIDDSA
jgi:hypothetical protein